jgi:hypothetical protein
VQRLDHRLECDRNRSSSPLSSSDNDFTTHASLCCSFCIASTWRLNASQSLDWAPVVRLRLMRSRERRCSRRFAYLRGEKHLAVAGQFIPKILSSTTSFNVHRANEAITILRLEQN